MTNATSILADRYATMTDLACLVRFLRCLTASGLDVECAVWLAR